MAKIYKLVSVLLPSAVIFYSTQIEAEEFGKLFGNMHLPAERIWLGNKPTGTETTR